MSNFSHVTYDIQQEHMATKWNKQVHKANNQNIQFSLVCVRYPSPKTRSSYFCHMKFNEYTQENDSQANGNFT